jgi:hypothetical protein
MMVVRRIRGYFVIFRWDFSVKAFELDEDLAVDVASIGAEEVEN